LSCRERSAIYWLRPTRPVLTIGTSIKRPKTQLRAIGSGLATSVVVWNSIDQQRKRIEACSGGRERECGIALCDGQTFAVERLPIFFPLAGLASPYSKWRATHRRIDSIEDLQTNNVRTPPMVQRMGRPCRHSTRLRLHRISRRIRSRPAARPRC